MGGWRVRVNDRILMYGWEGFGFRLIGLQSDMKQERKGLEGQRLIEYIAKLEGESSFYSDLMKKLQSQLIIQAQSLIKARLVQFQTDFLKLKKPFSQQLLTLKYFQAHPEEKGNLFALFNQIEEKISISFSITLPHPSPVAMVEDITARKLRVYEGYVTQLLSIVKSENVRKYCKKEAETGQKVMQTYQKMLQNSKESLYCTQVTIKKPFQEALSQLSQYKHVQSLTLALTTPKGIMVPEQYHQILNSLLPNRFFLSKFDLKLMDMQFSQQKCDILRKRLSTQFQRVKHVSIVNYYKECKLGQFQDFNWHPYRKKVHVNSGVW